MHCNNKGVTIHCYRVTTHCNTVLLTLQQGTNKGTPPPSESGALPFKFQLFGAARHRHVRELGDLESPVGRSALPHVAAALRRPSILDPRLPAAAAPGQQPEAISPGKGVGQRR